MDKITALQQLLGVVTMLEAEEPLTAKAYAFELRQARLNILGAEASIRDLERLEGGPRRQARADLDDARDRLERCVAKTLMRAMTDGTLQAIRADASSPLLADAQGSVDVMVERSCAVMKDCPALYAPYLPAARLLAAQGSWTAGRTEQLHRYVATRLAVPAGIADQFAQLVVIAAAFNVQAAVEPIFQGLLSKVALQALDAPQRHAALRSLAKFAQPRFGDAWQLAASAALFLVAQRPQFDEFACLAPAALLAPNADGRAILLRMAAELYADRNEATHMPQHELDALLRNIAMALQTDEFTRFIPHLPALMERPEGREFIAKLTHPDYAALEILDDNGPDFRVRAISRRTPVGVELNAIVKRHSGTRPKVVSFRRALRERDMTALHAPDTRITA
jgi:hypothetical protein